MTDEMVACAIAAVALTHEYFERIPAFDLNGMDLIIFIFVAHYEGYRIINNYQYIQNICTVCSTSVSLVQNPLSTPLIGQMSLFFITAIVLKSINSNFWFVQLIFKL